MADRADAAKALPIIYGALVVSIFVYAAVLEFAVVDATQVFPKPFLWGLFAAAAGTTVMSFVLPSFLLRRSRSSAPLAQQRAVSYILRWALSESVALFGLVMGLMNGPRFWVLAFFCWSLALMAVHHPFRPQRRGPSGPRGRGAR